MATQNVKAVGEGCVLTGDLLWPQRNRSGDERAVLRLFLGLLYRFRLLRAKDVIRQLATSAFMAEVHNLILVGGTGKTHMATALGVSAIRAGKRVRFCKAVDLVNQLEKKKTQDRAGTLARQLTQVGGVILDERGYLPFPKSGGALLFHLISQLYERTSLIITTNLNFGEWAQLRRSLPLT